jgi:hypothetical protein
MQRYFLKDGDNNQGPFTAEELKIRNLTAETPVNAEGTDQWIAAGQVDELKGLFTGTSAPVTVTEPAPVQRVEEVAAPVQKAAVAAAAAATVAPVAMKTAKKSTAWVTYVLGILILGGAGYFVYQGMDGKKEATTRTAAITTENTGTGTTDNTTPPVTTTTNTNEINTTPTSDTTTGGGGEGGNVAPVTAPTTTPTTTTTTTTVVPIDNSAAAKKAADDKKKLAAAEAKKKEEDKKKAAAILEAKRKEDALKKLLAMQMDMRNNWPRYITVGPINYEEHDGIKSFPVPVSNGTPYGLERVTVRVDYIKKEGKNVGSETLVISNIGAKGIGTVMAAGNKKAHKANIYITGVNSRGFHFCFPVNNGNSADPYFCN